MPAKHRRWCGRCSQIHEGKCPEHVAAFERKVRPARSGRGGSKWRSKRQRIFERDNYLCQGCLASDRIRAVTLHGKMHGVCDHKVPEAEGGTDANSNLQTLCQDCHKLKTQEESARGLERGRGGG